jgi:hypothetical protein
LKKSRFLAKLKPFYTQNGQKSPFLFKKHLFSGFTHF